MCFVCHGRQTGDFCGDQSDAANFGDRPHRQIWGPNVNNNIYILTHEYSFRHFGANV